MSGVPSLHHMTTSFLIGLHVGLKSPIKMWTAVFYPFGELRVHHEVVNVLLRFGELQLPGHHGHHEGSAARTLRDDSRGRGESTSFRGEIWAEDPACPGTTVGILGLHWEPELSGWPKPQNLSGPRLLYPWGVCNAPGLAAELTSGRLSLHRTCQCLMQLDTECG